MCGIRQRNQVTRRLCSGGDRYLLFCHMDVNRISTDVSPDCYFPCCDVRSRMALLLLLSNQHYLLTTHRRFTLNGLNAGRSQWNCCVNRLRSGLKTATVTTHRGYTPWVHTVATHPGYTPWLHTLATHPGYTPWLHTVATHRGYTPWLHTVCTHRGYAPCVHTVVTHPGYAPWLRTVGTHPGYTPWVNPVQRGPDL